METRIRATDIAGYIVPYCASKECPLTNLQLQQVLFLIQKDASQKDRKAFADDIEAWSFGPCIPNVYYHYCGYGAMPILERNGRDMDKRVHAEEIDRIVDGYLKRFYGPFTWSILQEEMSEWKAAYRNGVGNGRAITF